MMIPTLVCPSVLAIAYGAVSRTVSSGSGSPDPSSASRTSSPDPEPSSASSDASCPEP